MAAEAVADIEKDFPGCVSGGQVDRACLSENARADPSALARLEAIVHPLVMRDQEAFVAGATANGAKFVVLDVPLLFETGANAQMDVVIVVTARERCAARTSAVAPGHERSFV